MTLNLRRVAWLERLPKDTRSAARKLHEAALPGKL